MPTIRNRIGFNTKTHSGLVALQLDNDANPDIKLENLPADEVVALAAIGRQCFFNASGNSVK